MKNPTTIEEIIAEYEEKYTGLAWHTNPNSKELGQFLLQSLQKVEDSVREEIATMIENKALIKCECEDGDCNNCNRLCEVLDIINKK